LVPDANTVMNLGDMAIIFGKKENMLTMEKENDKE
jgi:hypothetical protein